jgi:hypothetical protein
MILEALRRAEYLMEASKSFIKDNNVSEYTTFYDDAKCDGYCLRADLKIAIEDVRTAIRILEKAECR